MSQSNNLNQATTADTDTRAYFNNFFRTEINVSQNVDDAIIGYFEQVSDSKEGARALAAAVIMTAVSQGINPMDVLEEFKTMDAGQLNSYLTMFLNLNRVGTSYLGVKNGPSTNKYVSRMIRP